MYLVVYSEKAKEHLKKFPQETVQRIVNKIFYYRNQENPLKFAKRLKNREIGQFRFRIGDYRAIFDMDYTANPPTITILAIKHRKNVYLRLLSFI